MDSSQEQSNNNAQSEKSAKDIKQPLAFLSSLYGDHEGFRERIYDLKINGQKHLIWVAEKSAPEVSKKNNKTNLEIINIQLERIRQCELFICILFAPGERRGKRDLGSPISDYGYMTDISHFEAELYQAAMLQKPIHLFRTKEYDEFKTKERTDSLLKILDFAFRDNSYEPMSEEEIEKKILELLENYPKQKAKISKGARIFHGFVQQLDNYRLGSSKNFIGQSEILFLNGKFNNSTEIETVNHIEKLLPNKFSQSTGGHQEEKLMQLLIVLRELMKLSYKDPRAIDYLPLWNKALGRWNEEVAWYGLHGPIYFGCLAALQSMSEIRDIMLSNSSGQDKLNPEIAHPGNQLASAYYSMAQLSNKNRNLDKALKHLELVMTETQDIKECSVSLGIQGSICLRKYHFFQAVENYKRSYDLRIKLGVTEDIGEAMCELGFGCIFTGHLFKGREFLEEGIHLIKNGEQTGFLIRAKHKLAMVYKITGKAGDARREKEEANQLATKKRMFDQLKK